MNPALEVGQVKIVTSIDDSQVNVSPTRASRAWLVNPDMREALYCIDALGAELSREMLFYMPT